MTNKLRRQAAEKFRDLMDRGMLRKQAISKVCEEFGISRMSLYRYCKHFKISTS